MRRPCQRQKKKSSPVFLLPGRTFRPGSAGSVFFPHRSAALRRFDKKIFSLIQKCPSLSRLKNKYIYINILYNNILSLCPAPRSCRRRRHLLPNSSADLSEAPFSSFSFRHSSEMSAHYAINHLKLNIKIIIQTVVSFVTSAEDAPENILIKQAISREFYIFASSHPLKHII